MTFLKRIRSVLTGHTAKNGMWLYCAQIFNLVCPMLSLPYITRILGAEQYGLFSIALNIITYLQVVVEYGFGMSATRKIAQKDDVIYTNKLFSTVLLSRGLLLVASAIFAVVYVMFLSSSIMQSVCVIILLISLVGVTFQVNWLFQGKQDMVFAAVTTMIFRIVSLSATFIFVHSETDLYLYCIIYALAPLISNAVSIIIAQKRYSLKLTKITFKDILLELKDGWYVFTTQLSSKVFAGIGITFLGIFATTFETGVYSTIQKIPYVITLVWSPIGQVIYPLLSQKYEKSFMDGIKCVKKMMLFFISTFGFLIAIMALFAEPIVSISFGEEFSPYFYWLYPLLLWSLLGILNNFLGIQILLASGHDRAYACCFYIGVVVNIFLNFVCIYYWGGFGASLAPLFSEILLTQMMLIAISKCKKGLQKNENSNARLWDTSRSH